jgi:hypothetical protein
MGRRKKQGSEIEAEMEGSGYDEPQGLAYLVQEFNKSINQTEGKSVVHLQENYDITRRGQVKIIETLKKVDDNLRKVDENQTGICNLLMQTTHKGKGPETYENRETGGSHGGNRYNPEKTPRYNFKHVFYHQSEGSHGGGGALHMDRWTTGPPLGCTFPHSQMNKHNISGWMTLLSRWHSTPGSTMSWI